MHPSQRARTQQQRRIRERSATSDAYTFFNALTGPEWFDEVEALLPPHRERLFPPTETLSMFLAQAMSGDRSCQGAVNASAVKRLLGGLPCCSTSTGGYCRARQRLPTELVRALTRASGRLLSEQVPQAGRWQGRPVRLADGTTAGLPDTPENQGRFPQSRAQQPGLGFPLCRLVGLLCLGSGAVLNAAMGPFQGKGADEQTLLRLLLDSLNEDDVLVGDALFAAYFLLCDLQARGVDGVFEQHGARRRSTDFRRGKRLGTRDHLVTLEKPRCKPDWMSQTEYEDAPETLTVRELHTGGKILVTTLLCPKQAPKKALKELYQQRWHAELDLRHIKTTLGMEQLSCKTPHMAEKELWVYLLAYNLIRFLMAQAAWSHGLSPREISFKHALQLWLACDQRGLSYDPERHLALCVLVSQQHVGNRPGRVEPRAVKRRPKPFPLLRKPREAARAEIRKYGHPSKAK